MEQPKSIRAEAEAQLWSLWDRVEERLAREAQEQARKDKTA